MKIIQDILILLLVYLPPLAIFVTILRRKKYNILILALISIGYIGIVLFTGTQNLLPFIFVLMDIRFMRNARDSYRLMDNENYFYYGFNIKSFRLLSALKYSGISYAITFTLSIVLALVLQMLKLDLKQQEIVTELMKVSVNKYIFMVPIMVIFAPVLEEFIFRWFLFEGILSKRIGVYGGAIISSLIFAFVHFNVKAFIIIFTLGIINCYLIHKKGFWYSVFNHMVFNSISTLAMLLQKIMG